MNIGIIGAGKWGQALYHAFSSNRDNSVVITSRKKRKIENFVPLEIALKREFLIITIPAQFIREWLEKNFIDLKQNILVASKGIEISSGAFLNEIYSQFIPNYRLAFISGPSFATEVKLSLPTALIISSSNQELAKIYANALPKFIKGYISSDIIGEEIAGAYKNVIAIAGGICDGLNLGNNAKAAIISRGLVEMSRFGEYFGAKNTTFLSLGGAGDLFLTANSKLSRNYRVGLGLVKNKSLNKILEELGEVAEGIGTAIALNKLSKKYNIYLPIAREIYLILNYGKNPQKSVEDLLK
jgi:glycerol-3-phosphate dehydrogenase (NAD(P)+)